MIKFVLSRLVHDLLVPQEKKYPFLKVEIQSQVTITIYSHG